MFLYTTQDIIIIVLFFPGIPAIITTMIIYAIVAKIRGVKILKINYALIKFILSILALVAFLWFALETGGKMWEFLVYGVIVGSLLTIGNEPAE